MNRLICTALLVASFAAVAAAQNQPTLEQLQAQYTDALNQLKKAQDRKNELDAENARLQKRVEEAEKKAQDSVAAADTLRDRTYFLRSHYAAFNDFLLQNPAVRLMWHAYFVDRAEGPVLADLIGDGSWPFTMPD